MSVIDLSTIEVGDEVAYSSRYSTGYSMSVVARITPTGIIVLEDGGRYRPDGREITSGWNRGRIEPLTDAILQKIRRRDMLDIIEEIKWEKIEDATLELVLAALQKEK
jgi:hypothetical protein